MRRALVLLTGLGLLVAAPAAADVRLDEFSVTPAETAAGSHPDVTVVQKMSYSTRQDDVRNSFVRLAPGLLGNPQNADFCGPAQFAGDDCPAGSQVGTVSARVSVLLIPPIPDQGLDAPGSVYNLPPEGDEPARLGLVLRPLTAPLLGEKVFLESPVVLRNGPGGMGLESTFANQPRTSGPFDVQIRQVTLNFSGQGSKGPFMRLPTACAPALSIGRASSYDSAAVSQRTSSFTPTACSALEFDPSASGFVGAPGMTRRGDSPPFSTTLHFDPEDAALKRAEVTIPQFMEPNLAAIGNACGRAQAAAGTCPPSSRVGTATIDSPLQARPVRGPTYIALNSASPIPGLILMLPPPVGLRLDANVTIDAAGVHNVFPSNPDLPVRSFRLDFNSGPGAPLKLGRDLCDPRTDTTIHVDLLAHSGKRKRFSTQLATPGCDPVATASVRRRGRRAKLVARVTAARQGPSITRAALTLPKGLRRGRPAPRVYVGRQRMSPIVQRRSLALPFPGAGVRGAVVVWRGLRAARGLRRTVTVPIRVTDARDRTTELRPQARVRGKRPRR